MFGFYITVCFCGLYSLLVVQVSAVGDGYLVVTPYLEGPEADVEAAVRLSEVTPDILEGVRSYSGFFNVNKECGNHIFFWFFPAETNWEKKPVLLWLKGAPGTSVMSGVFEEVGPLQLKGGRLVKMEHSWTLKFNVLFLDQPAGSGFSFTEKECYPNSVEFAMKETLGALKQFFVMFHQLVRNPFYITGGYFVSHYGPSLAALIVDHNSLGSMKINLQGVLIINSRTTAQCHDFSDILYQLGIADQKNREAFQNIHKQIVQKVNEKKFSEALELENKMFNKLREDTKLPSIHNFAANEEILHSYADFINGINIKKQLHVENRIFKNVNKKVQAALLPEYYSSPKEGIEYIVKRDDIFVGFFHGQMEVINPYSTVNCFLKTIEWPIDEDFTQVRRNIFKIDDKVIGWTKVVGNFFHILVRKAGRYLGSDLGDNGLILLETIFEPVSSNEVLLSAE